MRCLFTWLGADWDQFVTLLDVSIRIDIRDSSVSERKRKLSPIARSAIFYVWMGTFLAVSIVGKTTPFLYAMLVLAYTMVMTAFTVIMEFSRVIISPDDSDVLMFRPVSSRTFFLARLANLLLYTGLMGSALCLIPSFIGLGVTGTAWHFPLIYFPISILACWMSAACVVRVYTVLLTVFKTQRLKDIIAAVQIAVTFVIFFAYQLIPRAATGMMSTGRDLESAWLYAAPPAWFAGAVQMLSGNGRSLDLRLMVLALGGLILLALVAFRRISLDYAALIAGPEEIQSTDHKGIRSTRTHSWSFWRWLERLVPSGQARAGFGLTCDLLRRDRNVKMGVYPVFGIPFAVMLLAVLEGEVVDPFQTDALASLGSFSTMGVFFIFFMIFFLLMSVLYAADWQAGWVFKAAPIPSAGRLWMGVKLAVLVRLMLPFFVLLGLFFSTQMPFGHAVQHAVTLFHLGLVAFSAVSLFVRDFPFSRKRERGERSQRLGFLLFVMPFVGALLFVQVMAYQSLMAWWFTQGVLLICVILIEGLSQLRLNRILKDQAV